MKRPLTSTETAPSHLVPENLRLRAVLIAAAVLLGALWLNLLSALVAGLAGFVLYRRVQNFTGPAQGSWGTRTLRWLIVFASVGLMTWLTSSTTRLVWSVPKVVSML